MVASPPDFFSKSTRGLIVIEVKLCQEGNKGPLIQQMVLRTALLESKYRADALGPQGGGRIIVA